MIGRALDAMVAALRWALLPPTRLVRRSSRGWCYSNCIIFACSIWWMRWLKGRTNNYLTGRISWVTCGLFHVFHSRRGVETGLFHVVSYKPDTADKRNIELIFKGHVEYGERQQPREHS